MTHENAIFEKTVPFEDCDLIGHINHSNYLEYLEEARWNLYKEYDYTSLDVSTDSKGPIVIEANVNYRKEIFPGEQISILTRCQSYRGYIGVMEQKILKKNRRIACRALIHFAYFDLKERKMVLPQGKWGSIHQKLLEREC